MKNFYFQLLCLFLLSSCSPHLVTQGIKDKTSNYVITRSGQQIDQAVSVNNHRASESLTSYPLADLSAIKQGPAYYGVKNGLLYDGVYYGKLMLLRRIEGGSYDMNTHITSPRYTYYLQKQGQAEIVQLTNKSLIDNVQDNPLALRKAKAARIYTDVAIISAATFVVGMACLFLPYSSPVRQPAGTVGLLSMPVFLISLPIASHKKYKAIRVYNR